MSRVSPRWAPVFAAPLFAVALGCPGDPKPSPTPGPDPRPDTAETGAPPPAFASAEDCAACHPMQAEEWRGSMMHAAGSPTFAAFEIAVNRATGGIFAHGSGTAAEGFCAGCHLPVGVRDDSLARFDPADPEAYPGPVAEASEVGREGLTCDFCHSVTHQDRSVTPGLDGVGTARALIADPDGPKGGPLLDPQSPHSAEHREFLTQSDFCGTCHDVRNGVTDQQTGEPFLRIEDAFSEWRASPWSGDDNPTGAPVRCQDCHMSLFPFAPPGTRPLTAVAVFPADSPTDRPHANHAFTAVSTPLIDDPRFPNVDAPGLNDRFGYPLGQQQRREAMLRAACTMSLNGTASAIEPGARTLPVLVTVENVGAGHRVPTGFSQEREVWIELIVEDDLGPIYASGVLVDQAHPETGEAVPDGNLDDEDLAHRVFHVEHPSLEATVSPGPEADLRPEVQLGLMTFTNDFLHIDPETGERRVVFSPTSANAIDNTRSLEPFVPRPVRYDVPLPERPLVGDLRVRARLRYRSFPPEFLRALHEVAPELVDEALIDRNRVVDMAEAAWRVQVK